MQWGYKIGDGRKLPSPIEINVESHCHALITGGSGSGKSYAVMYLMGQLLQAESDVEVYFCDFKNSLDFSFLKGYRHYYAGKCCYDGVIEYYESFVEARENQSNAKRKLLIFDEYPACISYFSSKDKEAKTKKATEISSIIAEILMLGRGTANGYGVWIITQRADAGLFANGSRDNFMIILGLGRMSREQKGMIFAGEELPDKIYRHGEGCLLADGYPLIEVGIPRISNIVDWKKHIKEVLMKNN